VQLLLVKKPQKQTRLASEANRQDRCCALKLIFELLDENDAIAWENDTAYAFLQTMAAWLNDADGFYRSIKRDMDTEKLSWQLYTRSKKGGV